MNQESLVHLWPAGVDFGDVKAKVGISTREHSAFYLWDAIGVGDVDEALRLLKSEPELASREALCLDQTAATKAFACGETIVIKQLLLMPNAYFGFDPALKSPLMYLLYDERLLDLVSLVFDRGFYFAWYSDRLLKELPTMDQVKLIKGLSVMKKNLQTIEERGLLDSERFGFLQRCFDAERKRVYNAVLPN